jgi:hypothetical protein
VRISATLLESFRRWTVEEDAELADKIEAELVLKIRGEFHWTPEMRIGTAYHAIIERPQLQLTGHYEHDSIQFERSAIDPMLARIKPCGVFEVKTTRQILVPGAGLVTLVTKADHLAGAHLSEFKTTLSSFDSEQYTASYQWRIMALLFEPQIVTYHVACLKQRDDEFGMPLYGLRSLETMNVFTYPDLERDVRELVREFVSFVKARNLEACLAPRWLGSPVAAR